MDAKNNKKGPKIPEIKLEEKEEKRELVLESRGLGLRKRHIAFFLYGNKGRYERVGKKRVRKKNLIKYKGENYYFVFGLESYSKGLNLYYLFDINTREQLFFEGKQTIDVNKDDMDNILVKKVFSHFFSSIAKRIKMNWNSIITGIAIGGLVGFVAGVIFF